jgi:hypothetical protein
MGLPVLSHPTFSLTLPSTQQKVVFRPFLVKEEKILLIAQTSNDQTEVVRAIKQVITNCTTSYNDPAVNVEKFTTFDLEYFFIKLRSKSVQNIIKLSYRDNEDNKIYDVEVNLDEVEVFKPAEVNKIIQVSDTSSITLKYPQISIMNSVEKINDAVEFNFAIMQACIDTIKDGEIEYIAESFAIEEVRDFLESLDVQTYQKIQEFIEAMPRVEHTISYTNSLDREVKIVLRNLTDFFTLG